MRDLQMFNQVQVVAFRSCQKKCNVSYLKLVIASVSASHFAGVVIGIACYQADKAVVLCTRVFESLR